MDTSSIAAELQELQQYEIYEPIVRHLGGEVPNFRRDGVSICTSPYLVSAAALFIWDFSERPHDSQ
jgi:hypothetical protein